MRGQGIIDSRLEGMWVPPKWAGWSVPCLSPWRSGWETLGSQGGWVPKILASERPLSLLAGQKGRALTCAKIEGQLPEGRTEVSSQRTLWNGY